jgi:hypothetical protein
MKRTLICAALLFCSGLCSAANVYKWVDAQGKVQYGDRPPDGVNAELVPMLSSHATSLPQRTAVAATPSSPSNDAAKQAVRDDVEATRAKQCIEAKERYKKYVESRRLYKTDDSGQRVFLTGQEIDAARLSAKRDVDETCSDAS